jgi:chlorite dismutase
MTTATKAIDCVYFMLVKTTVTWLQLPVEERFKFLETTISPLLKKHPSVKLRFFDSEAFSAHYSDVLMWETSDLKEYQFLVEELRETLFWGTYFEIVEIVPAIENAYAIFYQKSPISSHQE